MKLNDQNSRYYLMFVTITCLLAGSFFVGMGIQKMFSNQKTRKEYMESELEWKQELAGGEEEAVVRDLRNQILAENMKYVSMERQLYFDNEDAAGEARITNDEKSTLSCKATIVRDATGEVVYQSGLIEPGYYVEEIHLNGGLRQGYYPCTVVWSFYTQNEEYAGETAWKVVVIIEN